MILTRKIKDAKSIPGPFWRIQGIHTRQLDVTVLSRSRFRTRTHVLDASERSRNLFGRFYFSSENLDFW